MINEKYTSIMFDLVDSRKLENRNEIQEYMKCIIEYLNKIFKKSLKKSLMFNAGDEVQGLFNSSLAAYLCLRFCMFICFPIEIRAGIGYGSLAFDDEKWNSAELDGEVYHNSRYAIESLSDRNSFGVRVKSKTEKDKYINALLYSSQLIQKEQSHYAQDVKLIAEFLFPIYDDKIMASYLDYKEQLNDILIMRSNLKKKLNHHSFININTENNKGMKIDINILNSNFKAYEVTILEILNQSDLIIDKTWKKGMSTMISKILGTTRQNIDKHIRQGKIEENRNIDFTVASYFIEGFENE